MKSRMTARIAQISVLETETIEHKLRNLRQAYQEAVWNCQTARADRFLKQIAPLENELNFRKARKLDRLSEYLESAKEATKANLNNAKELNSERPDRSEFDWLVHVQRARFQALNDVIEELEFYHD